METLDSNFLKVFKDGHGLKAARRHVPGNGEKLSMRNIPFHMYI